MNREFSSGGVVFKKVKGERKEVKVLWLIRRTTASKMFPETYWMLPKGWLDDAEDGIPGPMASGKIKADEKTLEETATREVAEETGTEAKIIKKIDTIKYVYTHPERGKTLKFVTYYLMEWVNDLPEGFDGETSEVDRLPYKEAYKKLSFKREKSVLEKARKLLNS